MKNFLAENWILLVIGIAFSASTALAVRNNYIIHENQVLIQQTDLVKQTTQSILTNIMHGLDLGVRGYGLTKDEKLLNPYNQAIDETAGIFSRLDSLLQLQNYPHRNEASLVIAEVKKYSDQSAEMIEKATNDDMEAFVSLLKEDKGYDVWSQYIRFSEPLNEYEDQLYSASMADYSTAIRTNLILQVAMLLLGLPMLYFFVRKVNTERKRRTQVLSEVDKADRSYVFDDGMAVKELSEEINLRSVQHIRQASDFVDDLTSGNYEAEWAGMNATNQSLNDKTLSGNLLKLRDRLKLIKLEDEQRNWGNEGLAKFSELVRNHQQQTDQLSIECISFISKYLNAQQGCIYVLEGEAPEEYLNLTACFAFDRRKHEERRIEIGQGLIGQAFVEGEPVLLTDIPQGYTRITSGLGDATPSCIAIVPWKHNQKAVAIVEIATFQKLLPFEVQFLTRAGEFFAAAVVNSKTVAKMKALLENGN